MPENTQDEEGFPEDEVDKREVQMTPSDIMLSIQIFNWAQMELSSKGNMAMSDYAGRMSSLLLEEVSEEEFIEGIKEENQLKQEWIDEEFMNHPTPPNDTKSGGLGFQ